MNAKISARILFYVNCGMSLPEAFDKVLGAGSYVKMAGELHAALTA